MPPPLALFNIVINNVGNNKPPFRQQIVAEQQHQHIFLLSMVLLVQKQLLLPRFCLEQAVGALRQIYGPLTSYIHTVNMSDINDVLLYNGGPDLSQILKLTPSVSGHISVHHHGMRYCICQ